MPGPAKRLEVDLELRPRHRQDFGFPVFVLGGEWIGPRLLCRHSVGRYQRAPTPADAKQVLSAQRSSKSLCRKECWGNRCRRRSGNRFSFMACPQRIAPVCRRCPLASASVGAFIDLFNQLDADERIKGKQFEQICKWFLANDPVYKHELRRVWLWSEWPGRWGADAGIDLVAEDRNGHLWAIQAKAYDPAYRVTKRDVNKFLAESGRGVFTYRMLIATTNLIDHIGERTIQDQEKQVTFFRLNDLQAASVDWPASPTTLRPTRPLKPARPHDYQREAINKVIKGFTSADRGQLIMACGTGKTLTALFITEKLAAERTLILVPSLSLLKQTLNVWRANCTAEFVSLPVCSDVTVARDDDVALEHTSDLGVPVTTDPSEIAAFLRRRSGPQVVFATY